MKLHNGITGFYDSNENNPPQIDGQQFKKLCFTILQKNRGKVVNFNEPQYPANFYDVLVIHDSKQLHILLNQHYPYLAFASSVEFGNITYTDEPKLISEFTQYFTVLSINELNRPIDDAVKQVNSAEVALITYWKPVRIAADAIFNFWD